MGTKLMKAFSFLHGIHYVYNLFGKPINELNAMTEVVHEEEDHDSISFKVASAEVPKSDSITPL